MYKVRLVTEGLDGWGWEVIITDNTGTIIEHTDVGYFDLDDWLDKVLPNQKYEIINETALV